jgi:uncharacterized protein (DUF2267 family)
MADFISDLASKAGVDPAMAQKGVGALLTTLQKYIPADTYSKVASAIPNASSILSSFQSAPAAQSSGGMSGLAGMAGGLLGGKSEAASTLISQFSKAGFSMDSVKSFLPAALGLLKDKISPDTMKAVEGALPGLSTFMGEATVGGGLLDKIKKMF